MDSLLTRAVFLFVRHRFQHFLSPRSIIGYRSQRLKGNRKANKGPPEFAMKLERSLPILDFVTGLKVITEKNQIRWKIEGFNLICKDATMINSQSIIFPVGLTMGLSVDWRIFLREKIMEDGKRMIEICIDFKDFLRTTFKSTHAELNWLIENTKGEKYVNLQNLASSNLIDPVDVQLFNEENIVIHITFKLFTPVPAKSTTSIGKLLEEFKVVSLDQLSQDMSGFTKNPVHGSTVKLISKDNKEFFMSRAILAARSKVFASIMLSADTTGSRNDVVIEIHDISSGALEVLLHFANCGVLLPQWKDVDVIVELTNAARKYCFNELLRFLDGSLGSICKMENVGPLAILARKFLMKVAEKELMMFVRKESLKSLDNFIKIYNVELPPIDDFDEAVANKCPRTN